MIQRSCAALIIGISTIMMAASGCAGTTARPLAGLPDGITRLESTHAGPVLIVIAGIHGDETSGVAAARHLAAGPAPARGTIIVLPTASPEALAVFERWAPHWSDLNRAFPVPGSDCSVRGNLTDPAYRRADAILAFIAADRPVLVLDLHESDRYWTEGNGPVLVVPASPGSAEFALALLEMPGMEGFSFTGPPPVGSLAAATDAVLGIPALIVEVPDSLPPDERVRLYGVVINAALRMLGLPNLPNMPAPAKTP